MFIIYYNLQRSVLESNPLILILVQISFSIYSAAY